MDIALITKIILLVLFFLGVPLAMIIYALVLIWKREHPKTEETEDAEE